MNDAILEQARGRAVAWDASRHARVLGRIRAAAETERRRSRAASVALSSLALCALVVLAVRALGAPSAADSRSLGAAALGPAVAWDDAGMREAASD